LGGGEDHGSGTVGLRARLSRRAHGHAQSGGEAALRTIIDDEVNPAAGKFGLGVASGHPECPIVQFVQLNRQVRMYCSRRMNDWCNRLDKALGRVPRLRKYSSGVFVSAVAPDPDSTAGPSARDRSRTTRATRSRLTYAARRIAYKIYELRNPDEPWLAPAAIAFLDRELPREGTGLEWGSGRSTQWFGRRLAHLVSIEMDHEWYERVLEQVGELPSVDLRYLALEHPLKEPTRPTYDPLPRYVSVLWEFPEASLDFVLVDGHYRQACVLAALDRIRPGGLLVVDNTDWLPDDEWGVPANWERVHRSANVITVTTIWRKPT
jgi:hypothetical protein